MLLPMRSAEFCCIKKGKELSPMQSHGTDSSFSMFMPTVPAPQPRVEQTEVWRAP